MTAKLLGDIVSVRGRFHRSVSLARDWRGGRDFSEYLVTPAVESIASLILDEQRSPNGTRAWSLIGPYGSGKSAFGLFLSDVLASKSPAHDAGRSLRNQFRNRKKPMVPVLVQGERSSFVPALLEALASEMQSIARPVANKARRLLGRETVSSEAVASLVVEAAEKAKANERDGLLLIVDEFGKFLEFASANPADGDIFVVQQIAEAAARSEVPILFATILHTSFADYVAPGDEVRRAEWQKVQGRFRDIPFQLPTEQLLTLVAHALETKLSNGIDGKYQEIVDSVIAEPSLADACEKEGMRQLLKDCLPLHPMASLILWPLFRSKVAQNERSLFAFLTSHEPHGFQEFLANSEASPSSAPTFGLAELYDYVASSLGLAAFSGSDSRRWTLIDHGIDRIPASAPSITRDIVKCIGLLSQYGRSVGLRANRAALEVALNGAADFAEALELLEENSIVVYRRHDDSYSLWEGSDLDLDEIFFEARTRRAGVPLHERFRRALTLAPAVARAHSIETGTLRFFLPEFCSARAKEIEKVLSDASQADGRILYLVDSEADLADRAKEISESVARKYTALVAVPKLGRELIDALDQWECWQWVRDHTTELEGDPVARQEVQARLEGARVALEQVAGPLFGLAGYALDPAASLWFLNGKSVRASRARSFQKLLSDVCADVFVDSPHLHNELLNRHNLSSAAARARRNLIECMVEKASAPQLGIEGFPPERSMYEAMLAAGGFHTTRGASRRLRPPEEDSWKPAWALAEQFVSDSASGRRVLTELTEELKRPPIGMREGPLPVLLAALLLIKGHEIALYEDGVYVPEVTIETLERLIRRPETFEVQSYRLSASEKKVLKQVAGLVGAEANDDVLLSVVRSLVKLAASLPPFVRQTRRLAPETCAVRDALLGATDPKALVFEELPAALGIRMSSAGSAAELAKALRRATAELSHAYTALLDTIEHELCSAFGLGKGGDKAKSMLLKRALPVVRYATDPRLQVFVREAARDHERDWREVLGRAAADGLPVTHWRDEQASGLAIRLQALANEFDHLEELSIKAGESPDATVVSIGVLRGMSAERRAVISCPVEVASDAAAGVKAVRAALEGLEDRAQLVAVADVARELCERLADKGDRE